MLWRKFNGEKIVLPIKEAVKQAIITESEKKTKLKVCIGTDSQVKANVTEFATVIVFLREQTPHARACSPTQKPDTFPAWTRRLTHAGA